MWQTGTPIHCLWLFAAHQAANRRYSHYHNICGKQDCNPTQRGLLFLTDTKLFSRFGSILFIYRILFMPLTKNVFCIGKKIRIGRCHQVAVDGIRVHHRPRNIALYFFFPEVQTVRQNPTRCTCLSWKMEHW